MSNTIVLGSQFGDEGKGKIVDYLADKFDYIVRFQGGNNAGHTVVVGDKTYKFHLIPSGVIKGIPSILGNGVVIDVDVLLQEMSQLENINSSNFMISEKAHVILFYHKLLDSLQEMVRENKIGTTGRGIGPCYTDKISRSGIRIMDLENIDLTSKVQEVLKHSISIVGEEKVRAYIQSTDFYSEENIIDMSKVNIHYNSLFNKIKPFVKDITLFLSHSENILFEGAQGTMLDVDHGTYPFVTSSSPSIGGAFTGTGVYKNISQRIGIVKAYLTRVGAGVMPTELHDDVGKEIQTKGNEFGTTTGRTRRCGWLDLVQLKYSTIINGFTEFVLTKLDVLDILDVIKICVGYEYEGKILENYPTDVKILEKCTPVFIELKGWKQDITNIKNYNDLPENAKIYISKIEELTNVRISIVSVGPEREQSIMK